MISQSINFYRGEAKDITLEIQGKHLNRDLIFVVKAGTDISLPRLIEKRKSRNEIITLSYNAETDITSIKIFITIEDTCDLRIKKYVYDIDSVDSSNETDRITCLYGNFNLSADVQTPFDGFETPDTAKRFITISAEEGNVGDMVQIQLDVNNRKVFKLISLIELKSQLNNL